MNQVTANVLLLLGGFGVLYFGAEWLVRGAVRLAASLGVRPIVVGLTVVSVGTSAPELVVGLVAGLHGNGDLVMGNVMGSNLANIGLILGITALVRPLEVTGRVVKREIPIMIAVTLLIFPLVVDLRLNWADGVLLLMVLSLYLLFVNRAVGSETDAVRSEFAHYAEVVAESAPTLRLRDIGLVLGGSFGLVLGGSVIVRSAEFLAEAMQVPHIIIGVTVVAIGTSLPELATSLVAALRKEADIAVGNVIGSNIFNLTAILGVVAAATPISVAPSVLTRELPAVLLLSVIAFPITWAGRRIRRWEGALLLAVYLGLAFWIVTS